MLVQDKCKCKSKSKSKSQSQSKSTCKSTCKSKSKSKSKSKCKSQSESKSKSKNKSQSQSKSTCKSKSKSKSKTRVPSLTRAPRLLPSQSGCALCVWKSCLSNPKPVPDVRRTSLATGSAIHAMALSPGNSTSACSVELRHRSSRSRIRRSST